jgi:hypothetical protein
MLEQCQAEYVRAMMPQQVGVGVKFAAELLAMGLRMTMKLNGRFIIITIDMVNAYNEIKRDAVVGAHSRHIILKKTVTFWRAKLGPTSKLWAGKESLDHSEGLVQGSPISSSGFSYTIDGQLKEADRKLAMHGGCARFGMDDGYLVGPHEVVFGVLTEFAANLKSESGCELNLNKCKMFSEEEGACARARREGHIPEELQHLQEGNYVTEDGSIVRGIQIFNVPLGEERYVKARLREKAQQVRRTTEAYAEDLGDEYPRNCGRCCSTPCNIE